MTSVKLGTCCGFKEVLDLTSVKLGNMQSNGLDLVYSSMWSRDNI
jgi:hypothetical protein